MVSDNHGNVSYGDMTSVAAPSNTAGGGARPSKRKTKPSLTAEKSGKTAPVVAAICGKPAKRRTLAGKATEITQAAAHKRVIEITDAIAVSDLATACLSKPCR